MARTSQKDMARADQLRKATGLVSDQMHGYVNAYQEYRRALRRFIHNRTMSNAEPIERLRTNLRIQREILHAAIDANIEVQEAEA